LTKSDAGTLTRQATITATHRHGAVTADSGGGALQPAYASANRANGTGGGLTIKHRPT
jgi:hypothetical protein